MEVDNNDAFVNVSNVGNKRTKKPLGMKLLWKKIKSHTCLEIFQSTNETNRRDSRSREELLKLCKNTGLGLDFPVAHPKSYSSSSTYVSGGFAIWKM